VAASAQVGSTTVRDFDWGRRGEGPEIVHDRVLTLPNAVTAARLAGLPLFVWLMLGARAYAWAVLVLVLVASTDWVDGYLARRLDQVSRIGKILDPLVDRLLIATVVVTMLLAGMVRWWLVALLLSRDLAIVIGAMAMFRRLPDIPVTRTGKFATFVIMFGLPGILLGHIDWALNELTWIAGWGLTAVGVAAYYTAGVQYVRTAVRLRRGEG
jgi:cardiolipin synthase (CMP-forming)